MKHILITIALVMLMCCSIESTQHEQHNDIIEQDLLNKQTELNILRELFIAQLNQDEESFEFFVSEYIRVPRLKLTDQQKQHPSYKEWLSDEIIKSGEFMDQKYNYVD